jgi:hypothetical protein
MRVRRALICARQGDRGPEGSWFKMMSEGKICSQANNSSNARASNEGNGGRHFRKRMNRRKSFCGRFRKTLSMLRNFRVFSHSPAIARTSLQMDCHSHNMLEIKGFSGHSVLTELAPLNQWVVGSSPARGIPLSCKDLHTMDRTCLTSSAMRISDVSGDC